jgi:hypothetical protein
MVKKVYAKLFVVAILGGCFYFGCKTGTKTTGAEEIKLATSFKPEALFSPAIVLSLSDTDVPATMQVKTQGSIVTFESLAHGTVFDVERYEAIPASFSLLEMVETYEPAVKLIGFPMSIGDSWDWNGVQTSALIRRKAKAKITSSLDTLHMEGAAGLETVKISVALEVESGVAKPRQSTLEFWFAAGKGIVKRTYGTAIVRRPANMKPRNEEGE